MVAGNARALHSYLESFSEYGEFEVSLGGEDVVVNHAQFGSYPMERAVRAVYDGLSYDIDDYDNLEELYTECDRGIRSDIKDAIENAGCLTVDRHDRSHFDERSFINQVDLSRALTTLRRLQMGVGDNRGSYGETPDPITSNAELVARLFSAYHLGEAEMKIMETSECRTDVDNADGRACMLAIRDAVEREEGWYVFEEPSPSLETVEKVWAVLEEFDEIEPDVELVYALFIVQESAMRYAPKHSGVREIVGSTLGEIGSILEGSAEPPWKEYFAESTPEEVRQEYMDS